MLSIQHSKSHDCNAKFILFWKYDSWQHHRDRQLPSNISSALPTFLAEEEENEKAEAAVKAEKAKKEKQKSKKAKQKVITHPPQHSHWLRLPGLERLASDSYTHLLSLLGQQYWLSCINQSFIQLCFLSPAVVFVVFCHCSSCYKVF